MKPERFQQDKSGVPYSGAGGHTFVVFSLAVAVIFNLLSVFAAVAGEKTDLQGDGLVGPAQSVRIETAEFSNPSGQWIEGPREFVAQISYDVKGNELEAVPGQTGIVALFENAPYAKTLSTYDTQGKKTETVRYNNDGSILSKSSYSYDAQGNTREIISYDAEGAFSDKIVYTYDDKGRLTYKNDYGSYGGSSIIYTYDGVGNLVEEQHYLSDLLYRSVHTYDAQGKRMTTTNYDAHDPGLGIEKTVTTYDARGNIKELTTYYTQKAGDEEVRPIPPPNRRVYAYEFDAHGNWVKQTETFCSAESGKPVCEPSLVTYRTLTYYATTRSTETAGPHLPSLR